MVVRGLRGVSSLAYIVWFCGVGGLLIGSFLNVVIYRVPRGESIATPCSHCPHCGHFLKPWELIPVISYAALRGRCKQCRTPITRRYAAVELLTAGLFILVAMKDLNGPSYRLFLDLLCTSFLIALTFIDLDTFRLPDVLVLPLLGVSLLAVLIGWGRPGLGEALLSSLGAGGLFFLVAWLYPAGMGLGDAKLVAALGAYLGFPGIFVAVFLASLAGSVIGVTLTLMKRRGFRQQIPFGPYLAFGALVVLLWGGDIMALYGSTLGR